MTTEMTAAKTMPAICLAESLMRDILDRCCQGTKSVNEDDGAADTEDDAAFGAIWYGEFADGRRSNALVES